MRSAECFCEQYELIAEYERYAAKDPLCCPSRTTTVVFNVSSEPAVLRPVSVSTTVRPQTACLKPSVIEQAFRDALEKSARVTIAGDRLDLFDENRTRVASFAAGTERAAPSQSAGLAGTSWQLVKFQSSDDTTLTPDDRSLMAVGGIYELEPEVKTAG